MQLYGEDKNLFLLDIPNPLAFVNDQKRAKKDECKKFMAEMDRNNGIIAVDGMVKVPINKKTWDDVVKIIMNNNDQNHLFIDNAHI